MQAAELKEFKEFMTKLKSLPQIQCHIELLSGLGFRASSLGIRFTFPLQAAELKELKEFKTKLKSLPQIQCHIELLKFEIIRFRA